MCITIIHQIKVANGWFSCIIVNSPFIHCDLCYKRVNVSACVGVPLTLFDQGAVTMRVGQMGTPIYVLQMQWSKNYLLQGALAA
jgi:hypothetical protein